MWKTPGPSGAPESVRGASGAGLWSVKRMKGILRAADRFCYKHPRFGISNLMLYIIIGNIAVYLFTMMDRTGQLFSALAFSAEGLMRGEVWRLVTFVLVPESGNVLFLAISLYFYYFIGTTLEREWGSGKFTLYYFSGMLFLILFGLLVYWLFDVSVMFTGYYLNLGLFFAFATFYPDMQVLLFFFIPIKVKWLALVDLAYFVIDILFDPFPVNLLPVFVLLHYLVCCGGWIFERLRPQRMRQRAKTVSFRHEAARIRREQEKKPYSRRCEVCGRTDVSNPELEFRYCSRCAGYHCFCENHINSHVHFRDE